ncbi:4309_t:CDS:2, partial [Dentiscutata erythropus]
DDPVTGSFGIEIEKRKSIYELKEEIKKYFPRLDSVDHVELALWKVNIPIDRCNAIQQFTFSEDDCLNPIKTIDGKIPENCLHIVFEIKPVYIIQDDVEFKAIQSFCRRHDSLPHVQDLEQILLMEFDTKIPIRRNIYDKKKKQIPMLDKYFCDENKENKTANILSSMCESATCQTYSDPGSLSSNYDYLISYIER